MSPNKLGYFDTSNAFSIATDPSFACGTFSLLSNTLHCILFFSLIVSMKNAECQKISWKIGTETFFWRFEKGVSLPWEKIKGKLKGSKKER